MKKISAVITSLCLAIAMLLGTVVLAEVADNRKINRLLAFGDSVIYGDSAMIGKINLLDLIAMRKYLAKWSISVDETATDCNADSKINLLDLILLRKYLAKWNVVLGPQK